MSIKDSNTRYLIQTSKEDKAKLEKLAKKHNRSLSNYINTILKEHLKNNEHLLKENNEENSNIKLLKEINKDNKEDKKNNEIEIEYEGKNKEKQIYDNEEDLFKNIYGIIYLVYNYKSRKCYIGKTTLKSFDARYPKGWLEEHKYKEEVREDLEKYGEESFQFNKVFKVAHDKEELKRLERYYIKYFNSIDNGYNRNEVKI